MTPDEERREILIVRSVVGTAMFIVAITVCFSLAVIDWTRTKDVLDAVKNGVTIVAVLIGGVWTYYNFIRGKIYSPRIELQVSGRVIKKDDVSYLVAIAQLKNVGMTRVYIGGGTGLPIYSYASAQRAASNLKDASCKSLGVSPVFAEHAWIASGTTIEDQRLFIIPADEKLAFCIQLRVVYNNKETGDRDDNKEANTGVIIEYPADTDAGEQTVNVKGTVTYERKT